MQYEAQTAVTASEASHQLFGTFFKKNTHIGELRYSKNNNG